jgi:hypothetical protein
MKGVPSQLEGLWRRKGIWRKNGESDLVTPVWWFQAERYHIDLRIPAQRSQMTGFAGTTVVEGQRCEWQPEIAYPFVSPEPDAGWLRMDSHDALHETGVDESYEEDWYRVPTGPMKSRRSVDAATGKITYVIHCDEWHAIATGHPDHPAEITISHRTTAGAWRIVASTIPARENVIVPAP